MPVLPFLIGLIAGAAAVASLRGEKARAAFDEAQTGVRSAAASGLERVRDVIAPKETGIPVAQKAPKAAKPARKRAPAKRTAKAA